MPACMALCHDSRSTLPTVSTLFVCCVLVFASSLCGYGRPLISSVADESLRHAERQGRSVGVRVRVGQLPIPFLEL